MSSLPFVAQGSLCSAAAVVVPKMFSNKGEGGSEGCSCMRSYFMKDAVPRNKQFQTMVLDLRRKIRRKMQKEALDKTVGEFANQIDLVLRLWKVY